MRKLATILCVTSVSLTAQWPNHPTPGIPRTPEGKPDLSAPVPRTADGKPDLSGVWLVKQGSYLVYVTSDLKPEEILTLPDQIRGYEQIKMGNARRVRAMAAEKVAGLGRREELVRL